MRIPSPFSFRRCLLLFAVLLSAAIALGAARQPIPARYKKWLEEDAAYIITNEEKKSFQDLTSDADRDRFIEHFWDVRNPTPGSPTNPYRDEHYRRIEYAN